MKKVRRGLIDFLRSTNNVYSELSGRGGIHIITYASRKAKLREESPFPWIEYKHDGYFIIYPTLIKVPEKEYRYEKLGGDLLDTMEYDLAADLLSDIFTRLTGREITIKVDECGKAVRRKRREKNREDQPEVKLLNIEEVKKLEPLKLKVLLYLLSKKVNCKGLEYLMKKWITEAYIPLPYGLWYMDTPRSTRFLFEHTILSILVYLGASDKQLEEIYSEIRFKHGDRVYDAGDNWDNIIYNISNGTLNLIRKGRCPFCVLTGQSDFCSSYPLKRIQSLSRDYVRAIVKKLLH